VKSARSYYILLTIAIYASTLHVKKPDTTFIMITLANIEYFQNSFTVRFTKNFCTHKHIIKSFYPSP